MARVIPRRIITKALFGGALEFDMFESGEPAGLQPTKNGAQHVLYKIASTAGAELPQEDEGAMESETCIHSQFVTHLSGLQPKSEK